MAFPLSQAVGSALEARAYFLLLRQKKVAKEKATPGSAPGVARSLALLGRPGGSLELACGSNKASRNPPACLRCSAPLMGTRKASVDSRRAVEGICCESAQEANNEYFSSSVDVFPGPLRGAEQRRKAGGLRRGLSEGRSPEFRSRPAFRVAQGTGRSPAPTQGWLFLWLLSLGHTKESTLANKAKPQANRTNKSISGSGHHTTT